MATKTSTSAKPFIKWVGGKSQLIPELVRRLPKTFGSYHEPFLGGAALFFNVNPRQAYLSDINAELINVYNIVKHDVDRLIQLLSQLRYESEYFYRIRCVDRLPTYQEWSDVNKACRFIYLNKTCFNGLYRINSNGFFNTPFGNYKNPTICDAENLRLCSEALQFIDISHRSFTDIEDRVESGDFVYFDPPYAPLTATANFTGYAKGGFGIEDQMRLFKVCDRLTKRNVKWMLSNSSAPLILDLYKDFNLEIVSASRAINSKGSLRGKINEVIVRNF